MHFIESYVISKTLKSASLLKHFKALLDRPAQSITPEIFPDKIDLDISNERTSKNGKAVGADHIPSEALEADIHLLVEILYELLGTLRAVLDTNAYPLARGK